MTESAARQRLAELERRYREFLDATDRAQDQGAVPEVVIAGIRAKYDGAVRELEDLRREHPALLQGLQRKYVEASTSKVVGTKSRWPKKGASKDNPTMEDLMDFVFEENLTLAGQPR